MPKENCLICQIIDGLIPSKVIFEDDTILAVLDVNGSNPGHTFVIPKNHYPILEQVPDFEVGRMFSVANKVSMSIFEALGVQGTNIFVTNGISAGQTIAHVMVNIIPRKENDGINMQWSPKSLTEEEMSTVELKLKEETKNLAIGDYTQVASPQELPEAVKLEGEENYIIRQLRRIP